MAHRIADRIRETTITTGVGTLTLDGAVVGFQSMSAALTSNGDTGFFFATNGVDWEVFLGTRASATTLDRTTIYASSNSPASAPVSWPPGSKDVVGSIPAFFQDLLNTIPITVTSAGTTDIGAVQGSQIEISGTTTITSFGTAPNKIRFVRFSDSLVLTHNATSLILPGAANITTVAGDTAIFLSDNSGNWRCWNWMPAAANTLTPGLTFGGGNTGMTFSVQTGIYVRDGRKVTFSLRLVLSAKGSSTGVAVITGLPIAAAATYYHPIRAYFSNMNKPVGSYTTFFGLVIPGTTTVIIYDVDPVGLSTAQLDDTYFNNTSELIIGGTYFI